MFGGRCSREGLREGPNPGVVVKAVGLGDGRSNRPGDQTARGHQLASPADGEWRGGGDSEQRACLSAGGPHGADTVVGVVTIQTFYEGTAVAAAGNRTGFLVACQDREIACGM